MDKFFVFFVSQNQRSGTFKLRYEKQWRFIPLLVSPGSVFVTVAQSAKCKVCCLWRNVFHFDGSMRDEHFFNLSVSSPFFFLDIYFTAVLFCHFFPGIPLLCELEIWVLELLMRFAQPRFADIFTRNYRPVTCNLVNTLK